MPPLLTYTKFFAIEDASALIEILQKEKIPYEIEKESNPLDSVYFGNDLDPMFAVKIPQDQFARLNYILEENAGESVKSADAEYYLYGFSNEELIAVIKEVEEWNVYDRELAQKILLDRKVPIPEIIPVTSKNYQPEKLSKAWLRIGYGWTIFPALFIFSKSIIPLGYLFIMPLAAVFAGMAIVKASKTLLNGDRVRIYDKQSINHGRNFIVIGGISLALQLLRFLIF